MHDHAIVIVLSVGLHFKQHHNEACFTLYDLNASESYEV
uniref:Uncharacterized protein n=1 Tax=Anguilla anguilla TaxID=7936 RepID=A0A0E9QZ49_ANGAN